MGQLTSMQTEIGQKQDDALDTVLLKRIAADDRDALSELFVRYQPRLFKFVFRLTSSYSIAEEMVNDVMLIVWRKAATFRHESKVSTWIFGIAYRTSMRRLSRRRLRLTPLTDVDAPGAQEEAKAETEDWVHKAIETLSPAHQLTVMLVFYLGLSYEEVAVITECPTNTVKTRMFHARKRLRGELEALERSEYERQ